MDDTHADTYRKPTPDATSLEATDRAATDTLAPVAHGTEPILPGSEVDTTTPDEQAEDRPAIKVRILAGVFGAMMIKAATLDGEKTATDYANKLLAIGFQQLMHFIHLGKELNADQARLFENALARAKAKYLEAGADAAEVRGIIDPVMNTYKYLTMVAPTPAPEPSRFPQAAWVSQPKAGDPARRREAA